MKKTLLAVLAGAMFLAAPFCAPVWAQTDAEKEIEELKLRVNELEKKMDGEVAVKELGHKLHPIHSLYGLKISGGVTVIAQGAFAGDNDASGQATLSADLVLQSPLGKDGNLFLVFEAQKGEGIREITLFAGPNGTPTGTNGDITSFGPDGGIVHLTQAFYEHAFSEKFVLTVGQIDPSAYFDANNFANNERSQFLANLFVNNPAIEFGGSEDWYALGARATFSPSETIEVTLGAFEGDGDYTDTFDKPLLMAEANFKPNFLNREGNYRVLYWIRNNRPNADNTIDPSDASLAGKENRGISISIDQLIADDVGVWFRLGTQDGDIAQFDKFIGGGVHVTGPLGRPNDSLGFGYGITFIGDKYDAAQETADPAGFDGGNEHYMEAYYNYAWREAEDDTGIHISPDIQYIVNPGGNSNADNIFVYGVRLQGYF